MGLFGGKSREERKKDKKIDEAINALKDKNYIKYISSCKYLINNFNSSEGALMLAKLYWNGDFAGEYNCAYSYFIKAIELGSQEAKSLFEEFKNDAIKDSIEQFHIWFNVMGYEVAKSYAQLASKCGSNEAKTMLEVLNQSEHIMSEVAIPYYNKAVTRITNEEYSKEVFDLLVKAAGMGLTEAMYLIVAYYDFAFWHGPENITDQFTTVYFPQSKAISSLYESGYIYGLLRWIRKAILAGNSEAVHWWYGKNKPEGLTRCWDLFNISENDTTYAIDSKPDILPKLPVPDSHFEYPEGTLTYESVKIRLGIEK